MKRTHFIGRLFTNLWVGLLCLALPALSWSDIVNRASVVYRDSVGAVFTGLSNTVVTPLDGILPPEITGATPSIVTVGDPAVSVTLAGTFPSDAQSYWSDGSLLVSTWVSPAQMGLMVPSGHLASVGDFNIQVRSPSRGVSNSIPFSVVPSPMAVFGATNYVLPVDSTLSLERAVGVSFTWTFDPDASLGPAPGFPPVPSVGVSAKTITPAPQLSLATLSLGRGRYRVTVTATNAAGKISAPTQTMLTLVSADFSAARVYPNPWRSARGDGLMTFDQMPLQSQVKIFTISGRSIKTLAAPSGAVTWDLTNDSGERIASGIYLYVTLDSQGNKSRGTFTVIR